MTSLGPMVYRSAHAGALLLIVGVLQFLVGMALAQYLYPYPDYSLTQNAISDLGVPAGSGHALVFNTSITLLGILGILGAILIRSAFAARTTARVGLLSLALASISAVLVGRFPEGSIIAGRDVHPIVSGLTFLFSGLALLFLSLAMIRDTRWRGMRFYTFLSGVVTFVALALRVGGVVGALGSGGMERLVVAPILLWGLLAGVHLLRIPRFRPQPPASWAGPGTS